MSRYDITVVCLFPAADLSDNYLESSGVARACLLVVGWLLNVPATGECISGTDLLRQFYVLSH